MFVGVCVGVSVLGCLVCVRAVWLCGFVRVAVLCSCRVVLPVGVPWALGVRRRCCAVCASAFGLLWWCRACVPGVGCVVVALGCACGVGVRVWGAGRGGRSFGVAVVSLPVRRALVFVCGPLLRLGPGRLPGPPFSFVPGPVACGSQELSGSVPFQPE